MSSLNKNFSLIAELTGTDCNTYFFYMKRHAEIGNESVSIQLAQCRFPGLAISSAKI